MKRHTPLLHLLLGLACLGLPGQARAAVTIWEELPYFSAADSPFYAGITAGDIYLEDFEDHELNTPHVISWDSPRQTNLRRDGTPTDKFPVFSRQIGRTHLTPFNRQITWSVDGDDGLNGDFTGLLGDTWTTLDIVTNQIYGSMEFRFTPDELGRYPSYVGFVVTEALDPFSDVEFGTSTLVGPEGPELGYDPLTWIPQPNSFPGDTRQHRFFGIHVPEGIWRLNIRNVRQMDHLQYGYAIPEPSAAGLAAGAALCWLAGRRWRACKAATGLREGTVSTDPLIGITGSALPVDGHRHLPPPPAELPAIPGCLQGPHGHPLQNCHRRAASDRRCA